MPNSKKQRSSRALHHLGVVIRPSEIPLTMVLFSHCLLIGIFQFSSKAVRQSLFVDALGAEQLPWVYLLVAVLAYPVVRFYASLSRRGVSWPKVMAWTCVGMAVGLVGFWFLLSGDALWVRFVLYLFVSICTVLAMSQFFLWAAQLLDSRQARRLFGFLGAGGLLGGILGGQVATLASVSETRNALLAGAVPLILAAFLVRPARRLAARASSSSLAVHPPTARTVAATPPGGSMTLGLGKAATSESLVAEASVADHQGGFDTVRQSPLLMAIAATTFVGVLVSQVVDLQFNGLVQGRTDSLAERTVLFGNLYSLMGLSGFLFQILLTSRIHRLLGVGFALRVMPLFIAAGSALLLAASMVFPPALIWIAGSLKAGENGLRYSLDQSTRELLFMPIPEEVRGRSKSYIDVLVQRLGKSAAAILLLTVTFGWISIIQASWLALVLCGLWLVFVFFARREYVASLRHNVSQGSRRAPGTELDLRDALTLESLLEGLASADGEEVLSSLELLDRHERGKLVSPLLLHHSDPRVRLRTLEVLTKTERRDALSLIERLIADEDIDVRATAVASMARLSGRRGTALMEGRVNDPDMRVRTAAIACLVNQGDERQKDLASASLGEMLSDAATAVRIEAARAVGEVDEPSFRPALVALLYDGDSEVVSEALEAVRKRTERCGVQPHYTPILISLLRNRRLKHQARSALIAVGEIGIPALEHFMLDPNEQLWVRRALPKTLSGIGGSSAKAVLLRALDSDDRFLKAKVVEALLALEDPDFTASDLRRLEEQVIAECELGLRVFQDLAGLTFGQVGLVGGSDRPPRFKVSGGRIVLSDARPENLLEKILAERFAGHVDNAFRLLELVMHDLRFGPLVDEYVEMRALRARLSEGVARRRADALEYLDNVLPVPIKRWLMVLIDDLATRERLSRAEKLLERPTLDRAGTLRRLAENPGSAPIYEEDGWLMASALHAMGMTGDPDLRAAVERVAARSRNKLVKETAQWVLR